VKRLLLLGGGHAHLRVLAELAQRPPAGWQVCLLTSGARQIYSGMLPGWVAGHYTIDECAIDLRPLSARAGAELRLDAAVALDTQRQIVRTAGGDEVAYDALSLDVGSAPNIASLAGAAEHGVMIRPIEGFVAQWPRLVERLRSGSTRFDVAVLGSGAAGLELAFALRQRGIVEGWSHLHVHLFGAEAQPLPSSPERARETAVALLRQKRIAWQGERRALALDATGIRFDDGSAWQGDACWVVTGSAAPPWLATAELARDASGFVRVNSALQSVSHPNVFAAGDVASHAPSLPKSGVYAVRGGQPLAMNLLAHCAGQPLQAWRPQSRALYLISTGDSRAMALWGDWQWTGRSIWYWKDAIDRRFVRSYAR
jgi:selenide,water dikinase